MATNFPTSLDSLTNPASSDQLNVPSHSLQHANANDAIEALETKVGINNSGGTTSLDYRVNQLETVPTYTNEMAQDAVAAALAAGTHTNITINYNDTGNSISISAAAGYTNEEAVDAVAAALTQGSGISIAYNDAANTITISVDSSVVLKTGATMTGALTLSGAPTTGLHAATKTYVDTATATVTSNSTTTYVPLSSLGIADGVAVLNADGNLIVPENKIIIEGATADAYELTLQAPDVTSDITVTLPNFSGTLATTVDVSNLGTLKSNTTNPSFVINGSPTTLNPSWDYATFTGSNGLVIISSSQLASYPSNHFAGDEIQFNFGSGSPWFNANGTHTIISHFTSSGSQEYFYLSEFNFIPQNGLETTSYAGPDTIWLNVYPDSKNISSTEIGYLDGVTSGIQNQINLKSNVDSPTFTGTPLAPTASAATNTTQIATTAFVSTAVNNLINSAPGTLDTLGEIATALAADESAAASLTTLVNTKAPIASPTFTGTVAGITSTMVGLGNVNNTSDANKPVSTATQTALDLKAPLASPTFTGTVSGITKTMVGLGSVDNTTDAAKPISTATQTALDLKLASATAATTYETITNVALKAPIASPTFTGTVSGITKTMVGLGSVDNTTDALKPISTATQTALDLKSPIASPTFTGTVAGITKSMVGLSSVDNTADTAKPVSTAQQTALDLKANLASPTFTGAPLAPTATAGTNTTQLATTAFVKTEITSSVQPGAVYQTSAPASPAVGQIWIDSDEDVTTFDSNIFNRQSFTATASQTVFTSSVPFIEGYEQVYFNGLMLSRSADYTTSGSNTVTLSSGAAVNDIVEIVTITALNAYVASQPVSISANTNLAVSKRYFVTSASALTLTLPANPSLNDQIDVIDASGNALTYNITIARNGKLINGLAVNLIIDTSGSFISLLYTGPTYGWRAQ